MIYKKKSLSSCFSSFETNVLSLFTMKVLMGQFETTVNDLTSAASTRKEFKLRKKGKDTGTITVQKAEVSGVEDELTTRMAAASVSPAPVTSPTTASFVPVSTAPTPQPDFIDYVSGGCELNVMVAIDFTGSNWRSS